MKSSSIHTILSQINYANSGVIQKEPARKPIARRTPEQIAAAKAEHTRIMAERKAAQEQRKQEAEAKALEVEQRRQLRELKNERRRMQRQEQAAQKKPRVTKHQQLVLNALQGTDKSALEVSNATGLDYKTIYRTLSSLVRRGFIRKEEKIKRVIVRHVRKQKTKYYGVIHE